MLLGLKQTNDTNYQRWVGFVCDALNCIKVETDENGNIKTYWLFLPNSGGYYDQDSFFITVWEKIRQKYHEVMSDTEFVQSLRGKYGKSKS